MMKEHQHYLSEMVKELKPSGIRKFFDLAASIKGVISLGVGEPDFITPWSIREAAILSLEEGYTSYTAIPGTTATFSASRSSSANCSEVMPVFLIEGKT